MGRLRRVAKSVLPESAVDWIRSRRPTSGERQADSSSPDRPSGFGDEASHGDEVVASITELMLEERFESALELADEALRSPGSHVFGATSLAVDCCLRLGREREGMVRISRLLDKTLPDSSTEVRLGALRSRVEGHLGPMVAGLNRIYLRNGLVPLFAGRRPGSWNEVSGSPPRFEPHEAAPLVSIILPALEHSDRMELALAGLAAQSWRNQEVIVVTTGAVGVPHGVVSVVERDVDSMLTAGRERASGSITLVHRADEWSHPQRVELQVAALQPLGSRRASGVHSIRLDSESQPRPVNVAEAVTLVGPNHGSVSALAESAHETPVLIAPTIPMSVVFSDTAVAAMVSERT